MFSALGAEAAWNEESKKLVAEKEDTIIILELNRKYAEVNGKILTLDQPPGMHGGQLMVPLRFVSETFGAKVHWDGETKIG